MTFAVVSLTMMGWATPGVILGLFGTGLLALIVIGSVGYFLLSKLTAARYTRHHLAPTP